MKILPFVIPAAAALLPQQNKYIKPEIPEQKKDEEPIYQDATEEHAILLRKYDDSERFLRFAGHSSHKSHSSHRSHSSHSSHSSGKHNSHTSHTSGSYGTGTTASSTKSATTSTTPKETTVAKKITLGGSIPSNNYSVENYANLNWKLEGFTSKAEIYIYQDNKQIFNFHGTSTTETKASNLKYNSTIKYQVKVEESGKSYWSNVVTLKTGEDPFKYDKKDLPFDVTELDKEMKKIANSIEDTIELPETTTLFISDFISTSQKNELGREAAISLRKAYKGLNKYKVLAVTDDLDKKMKVAKGTPDYHSAVEYGANVSADYVVYGEIGLLGTDQYKIKIKVINILEQNILTEKETLIPKK